MSINILAIESSCDETSAAVMCDGQIRNNLIATQSIHAKYGGVVPELASRAHQQKIVPVVDSAIKQAGIRPVDLSAVAFTEGPGLLGALLVGSSFAKSMALALDIPLIAVNHMQAHILAHFIEEPKPQFPFLCLTVSGGHTQIVRVNDHLDMKVIGQTRDDAVGEAFDKCAKILGLEYPGGPLIDQYAKHGDASRFSFPATSIDQLDYSFSGIKTAFLYFIRDELKKDENFVNTNMNDICASIQRHLVDMLTDKLVKASKKEGIKDIGIAGGVSANCFLRSRLEELGRKHHWRTYIPKFEYCTDNAAMIAMTAHFKYLSSDFSDLSISAQPRLSIQ